MIVIFLRRATVDAGKLVKESHHGDDKSIPHAPPLELRDVSVSFDDKPVLRHLDLRLERGEMVFVTGVFGSGKSVLMHLAIIPHRHGTLLDIQPFSDQYTRA